MLTEYDYNLHQVPGSRIGNADALSRLPQKLNTPEPPKAPDVLMFENIPERVVDAKRIASETAKDPILSKVLQWNEISCYLWGTRVITPPGGRKSVTDLLHFGHPGMVKMKALARSYVWWPNLDRDIENKIKTCSECQEARNMPRKAPVHPWEWSRAPRTRLHLDFAGPMNGKSFLIVIDSFSGFIRLVPNTSSAATIKVMRENGTAFTSEEFQQFLKTNQIRQGLVASYHPSSNGQAQRMVQNVKNALKKMGNENVQLALSRYLLTQHITPHSVTGQSPADVLMGRKLATILDPMQPDFTKEMSAKQEDKYSSNETPRSFQENDPVFVRSYAPGQRWLPSTVIESTGPLSYKVKTPDGKITRRHTDEIRPRTLTEETVPVSDGQNYDVSRFAESSEILPRVVIPSPSADGPSLEENTPEQVSGTQLLPGRPEQGAFQDIWRITQPRGKSRREECGVFGNTAGRPKKEDSADVHVFTCGTVVI
ncbi:uncharacterized protein K02A2.6-like isoform X3 [Cylas formicarius]|uniref:uncharacterized protein K02A2.6-like isoform X3 n=1 Tax=Cylas formicarius TaxID=197179 RepID=UPI002958C3FC|nr:uncharacterized protein K02A2.6-like isoform X3 [Cylas formicarius]